MVHRTVAAEVPPCKNDPVTDTVPIPPENPTDIPTEIPNDIHVAIVRLDAMTHASPYLSDCLSAEEKQAANRFAPGALRRRAIASRQVLRHLLAEYLAMPAHSIRIDQTANGKPAIRGPLRFNLSHSGAFALYAFARCDVGIDVEEIRPFADFLDIARRFFCPEETADITSLPHDQQESAFFRCWTRKEAYIKAIGDGLSMPLDSFRVSVAPDEPAHVIQVAEPSRPWSLHDIDVATNYAASLAYPGPPRLVIVRRIDGPDAFAATIGARIDAVSNQA